MKTGLFFVGVFIIIWCINYRYIKEEDDLMRRIELLRYRINALESLGYKLRKGSIFINAPTSIEYLLSDAERRVSDLERCYQCPLYQGTVQAGTKKPLNNCKKQGA